jgi:hypothetical protein
MLPSKIDPTRDGNEGVQEFAEEARHLVVKTHQSLKNSEATLKQH